MLRRPTPPHQPRRTVSESKKKRRIGLVPTTVSMSVALLAVLTLATARGRVLPRVQVAAAAVPAVDADLARIELLTYNVFVRPQPISFGDETTCRSQRIGEWLAQESGSDIVVLTETFLSDDVELLSKSAVERFPHQALSLPEPETVAGISGGLSILSRWPIEEVNTEAFEACSGTFSDCLATKGIVHAVVRIAEDLRVNVLATHLDAGRFDGDAAARHSQLRQMVRFAKEHVDLTLPTFVMGDFNVNGFPGATATQYPEMLETLGKISGSAPVDAVRSLAPIWSAESMLGRLFNTMNCSTTIWCGDDSPNFDAMAERRKRLDYVFLVDDLRQRTRVVEAEHLEMEDGTCGGRWLSDHKAVRAAVEIDRTRL